MPSCSTALTQPGRMASCTATPRSRNLSELACTRAFDSRHPPRHPRQLISVWEWWIKVDKRIKRNKFKPAKNKRLLRAGADVGRPLEGERRCLFGVFGQVFGVLFRFCFALPFGLDFGSFALFGSSDQERAGPLLFRRSFRLPSFRVPTLSPGFTPFHVVFDFRWFRVDGNAHKLVTSTKL